MQQESEVRTVCVCVDREHALQMRFAASVLPRHPSHWRAWCVRACGRLLLASHTADNACRQAAVGAGLLPLLREVMQTLKGEAAVMKQACAALANIAYGVCVCVSDG